MPIVCFHFQGKFCIMSKPMVCLYSWNLWQRLVKTLKEPNFYIWKQSKGETESYRTNLVSGNLSTADFSLSSDEYLEAESGPHSDKNNIFSQLWW